MTWLNYHHLYYFLAVAREGGVAAAAKKLRLGQPTVSTQIQKLEESLGQTLFERRNRRMILTEAGRMTLSYAEQIFKLGDELLAVTQDRLVSKRIHVQIGALDSVAKSAVLTLVRAAYGIRDCTISLLEGKGDELLRELLVHNLDILLTNYQPGLAGGVHAREVATMPVVIVGSGKFKKLANDFPRSLAGQPFVMPTGHSKLRHDLDHFLRLHDLQVDVIAETQDTSLAKLLAADGVGLLPLARPAGQSQLDDAALHAIGALPGVREGLWLATASRRIENPVAKELMKSFRL